MCATSENTERSAARYGEPVTFVVGIAGRGEEHLGILSQIAILFSEEDEVARLKTAATPDELFEMLRSVND